MACRDPGGAKCAGTRPASAAGVTALLESFSEPLVAGDQRDSGQSFSVALPLQELRGVPCLESLCCLARQALKKGTLDGVLLCSSVHQSLKEHLDFIYLLIIWVLQTMGGDGTIRIKKEIG